jgi:hypothetical protein
LTSVPDAAQEEIRALIRLRLAHQREVERAKHRIQGMLLYQGQHFSGTKCYWTKTHRVWLRKIRREVDGISAVCLAIELEHLEFEEQQAAALDRTIERRGLAAESSSEVYGTSDPPTRIPGSRQPRTDLPQARYPTRGYSSENRRRIPLLSCAHPRTIDDSRSVLLREYDPSCRGATRCRHADHIHPAGQRGAGQTQIIDARSGQQRAGVDALRHGPADPLCGAPSRWSGGPQQHNVLERAEGALSMMTIDGGTHARNGAGDRCRARAPLSHFSSRIGACASYGMR